MVSDRLSQITNALERVMDPELPFLSITELGMIRGTEIDDEGKAIVHLSPTYSGCPATDAIQEDIRAMLSQIDSNFEIKLVLSPAWTTDWIQDSAKEKMRQNGIAPPEGSSADKSFLLGEAKSIACPQCGSNATKLVSPFGSTACKAHFKCEDCLEPFDHFKCI